MGIFKKKRKLGSAHGKVSLVTKNSPSSIITEQFRTVQTNISFANMQSKLRSFMVTSDKPSQGKSTVSANLAITCAQQGEKVVLVDADMRRAVAHKAFDLDNNQGLSTSLSGMSDLFDSVKYTDIDNLLVMPSGPVPPNPSELLNGDKFAKVLNELYQHFDLVIVDTPPVNSTSDASVLANKVDGTVLVIPQGIAEKSSVIASVTQLRKVHANILGAILNNVKDQDVEDYYYYK